VEALITRLRKKLGAEVIETRRGFGYLLEGGREYPLAASAPAGGGGGGDPCVAGRRLAGDVGSVFSAIWSGAK
jgi:hypothetical protein